MTDMQAPRGNLLELKIPPPVVALLSAMLAWWLARNLPEYVLQMPWRVPLAAVLVLAGSTLELWGLWAVHRARTTFNPLAPQRTVAIVRSGPYRFTRNPMYLGLACTLSGVAVWLAHPLALLAPAIFVAWVTRFQIVPEERVLGAAFGAPYADYLRQVRRWL
jgi:protein-S-isoprenylcysteine O-methyltransferase Ste14